MSDAFVRGGGGEIRLDQLPVAKGKAFWMQHEQSLAAELYETEHPGVTVIRPWETKEQHEARKAKRKPIPMADPDLTMAPDRAQRELRIKRAEIASLPLDHPKYAEMFDADVRYIHQLEDVLGLERTRYVRGTVPKKAGEAPSPELIQKVAKYKELSETARRRSIEKGENVELLAMIAAAETDPALQALATERIGQLAMKPQEPVKV